MTAHRSMPGLFALALSVLALAAPASAAPKARVLIYSGSTGFRHDSIPAAVEAVKSIATKSGYSFDATEDPEVFTTEKLSAYKAIVFVSNTTNPKNPESEWFVGPRRDALVEFLKAGKGVVGLHAAADSHYHWKWYGQMMGGYFERHPKGTPKATQTVVDAKHPNPVVWYHEFGGGRVFYNGLGHTSESYAEPYMVDLISGGLKYAVGRK
ncbi:MAG: ThuA protein [Steroidobacteraceae bacterium]|nr:ThuA protein [Steroidobacteraceae bacterium]